MIFTFEVGNNLIANPQLKSLAATIAKNAPFYTIYILIGINFCLRKLKIIKIRRIQNLI